MLQSTILLPPDMAALARNFSTIQHVVEDTNKEETFETIWSWTFVSIVARQALEAFNPQTSIEELPALCKSTHKLWHRELKKVPAMIYKYKVYLIQRCSGKAFAPIEPIPQQTINLVDCVFSFFALAKQKEHDKIREIVEKYFCSGCYSFQEKLQGYYEIINLTTCMSGSDVPFELVKQLAFNENMNLKTLDKWINELHDKWQTDPDGFGISTRVFGRFLRGVVCHLNEVHTSEADKILVREGEIPFPHLGAVMDKISQREQHLAVVEKKIVRPDISILNEIDPQHMKWRNTLREGAIVISKKYIKEGIDKEGKFWKGYELHEITLGKQIGKSEAALDNNVYYEIAEYFVTRKELKSQESLQEKLLLQQDLDLRQKRDASQMLFWSSVNEAIPFSKEGSTITGRHFGLKLVKFYFIDKEGRFALVEKLHTPFYGPEWNHLKYDLEMQKCVVEWLDKMGGWSGLPLPPKQDISIGKYTMLDADNALTSLRRTDKTPFNIMAVEKLAFDLSEGDLKIFQIFVNSYVKDCKSLYNHSDIVFVRETVLNRNVVSRTNLKTAHLDDFAVNLRKQLTDLADRCFQIVFRELTTNTSSTGFPEIDKARMHQIVIEEYEKIQASTFLWNTPEFSLDKAAMIRFKQEQNL